MRLVIAAGGTGGHVYPGIAVAREFRRRDPEAEILFIGTHRGLEARILPMEGFRFRPITARGWVGRGWMRGAAAAVLVPWSGFQAVRILREFRPDLVLGVGGYSSGPVVAAAVLLRIPRVVLEPNALPGLTNRWLAPWAQVVFVAFEETKSQVSGGEVVVSGNPVRREIAELSSAGPERHGPPWSLLVTGGSLGARSINRAMIGAAIELAPLGDRIRIRHQTGERDYEETARGYREAGLPSSRYAVAPYLDEMGRALREADLVVSRAGATTVAELTAAGKPAVLVPYPHAAHHHQERNARAMEAAGGAVVIRDEDLTGERLGRTLRSLLEDPARLRAMAEKSRGMGKRDAADRIVDRCVKLVEEFQP
jgi:UDP-N-acetylglucosamine--N-acetylmuramyl-(pentapeptide) pyrophosphoryl-undecaprenol N-acetylglucosamine transferase